MPEAEQRAPGAGPPAAIRRIAAQARTALHPMRIVRGLRDLHWSVAVAAVVALFITACLVFAPLIAPYSPASQDLVHRFAAPSAAHWLGTDHLGRDVFSRVLYGGRFSVSIAAVTLVLSVAIGVLLGAISARAGGWVDEVLMRIVDLAISFPDIVVALFMTAILGPGYVTLIVALTAVSWTPFARLMRGLALEINGRDYIRAAEILNCSRSFIILRHVIPNAARPIATIAFLRFGHKLITVGGLSFLGLGVQPPMSDWGAMLAESRRFMDRMPMLVLAPGIAIFITALTVTVLGQGLDAGARPGARRPASLWHRLLRRTAT